MQWESLAGKILRSSLYRLSRDREGCGGVGEELRRKEYVQQILACKRDEDNIRGDGGREVSSRRAIHIKGLDKGLKGQATDQAQASADDWGSDLNGEWEDTFEAKIHSDPEEDEEDDDAAIQ